MDSVQSSEPRVSLDYLDFTLDKVVQIKPMVVGEWSVGQKVLVFPTSESVLGGGEMKPLTEEKTQ